MKPIFALLFCLFGLSAFCQKPALSLSEPFDEPEDLGSKVVLCANGNTLFINFIEKEGISVNVYDAAHKMIAQSTVTTNLWKIRSKGSSVLAIYDMGTNVVVLGRDFDYRKEQGALYRIVISPETGNMIREDQVLGGDSPEERSHHYLYTASRMPGTGTYAVRVISYPSTGKRTTLIAVFDSSHKEISRVLRELIPDNYSGTTGEMGELQISPSEAIYCWRPLYKVKSDPGGPALFFDKDHGTQVDRYRLRTDDYATDTKGEIGYNKVSNLYEYCYQSLINSETKQTGLNSYTNIKTYKIALLGLDPNDFSVKYTTPVNATAPSKYLRTYYKADKPFGGSLDKMFVNPDGSTTIVLQDYNIGIIDYDKDGKELSGYALRRANGGIYEDCLKSSLSLEKEFDGFFSYSMLQSPKGRYIFFNDHPDNFNIFLEKAPRGLQGVSDANTACYRIADGAPNRFYLFGEPDNTFDNRFAALATSCYSETRNEYAVMIIEKKGRKKQARVAWLDFK